VPFWGAFAAGVAFAGLAGMILALFAVRLRGHYLAIASLGFAVIIHQILLNWISLTQGPLGIYAIRRRPRSRFPACRDRLPQSGRAVLPRRRLRAARLFHLDQLVRSPIGETLIAIREDDSLGLLARHQRGGLEGVRLRRRRRGRRRGRAASTRPSSARWCRTRSSSPSPSPSCRW
jgi:hypothetical protein